MKGIKHVGESEKRTAEMRSKMSNKSGYASGGRVKSYPEIEYGSLSGLGRLEKKDAYGKNAKKK